MNSKNLIISILLAVTYPFISSAQTTLETTLIKIKDAVIVAEVAATTQAMTRGFMYRDEVPDGTGMLFVYSKPKKIELWMRHTYVKLSAAFIKEDGTIVQIVNMEKTSSMEIYRSKEKVKYALEVPLGFFEKHGITIGDYCEIDLDETAE